MRLFVFGFVLFFAFIAGSQFSVGQLETGWKAHDLNRSQPVVVKPAEKIGNAPSDAIVLFDGTDMSKWRSRNGGAAKWKIVENAMESVRNGGYVFSRQEFGDCQVHLEFASPKNVKGNGQGRGNSGVFLMGEFEIQVLDSFDNQTYADGSAGSVYGQYPPLVNASRGPGQWQTYDIVFRRPRFDGDGKLIKRARLTVLHNGVLVQDASLAFGPTNWIQHHSYAGLKNKTKGPLGLQDHGNPVRYRNIWVRPLVEVRPQPEKPYDAQRIELDQAVAKRLVGRYGGHRVEWKNENLVFNFNGNTPMVMVPHSETEFGFTKSAGNIKFDLNEDGIPTGIELNLDAAGKRKAIRK
ncbi:MAG: DUF1080 domain-containing protein [Mariniblastus sp.]|nr:DUF1080 domain-containing protein [Mariniblastus sp.]